MRPQTAPCMLICQLFGKGTMLFRIQQLLIRSHFVQHINSKQQDGRCLWRSLFFLLLSSLSHRMVFIQPGTGIITSLDAPFSTVPALWLMLFKLISLLCSLLSSKKCECGFYFFLLFGKKTFMCTSLDVFLQSAALILSQLNHDHPLKVLAAPSTPFTSF